MQSVRTPWVTPVVAGSFCALLLILLPACSGITHNPPSSATPPQTFQLTVKKTGTGTGTVTSAPSGVNCGSSCTGTFNASTQVTLTASPSAGSQFNGWSGACSGTKTCVVTVSSDTSVTANFAIATVPTATLTVALAGTGSGTVTSSPTGINCGTGCSSSFNVGTQVTLTATPAAGSTFAGWSGGCSGTAASCVVTLNGATSVTATFNTIPQYALTVTTSGQGTVTSTPTGITCPSTCSANFTSGTPVTLLATAAAGYNFAGWGGACSGTASTCNVTMSGNQSVSATFTVASGLNSLNHIIFLAQENRSFDHYFGELRKYWADNGYPDQSFDGLPQFNPTPGPSPTNPTCDNNNPGGPPFGNCTVDNNSPIITSFHLITQCIENPSPFWDESHYNLDWANPLIDPSTPPGPPMNGFVSVTAHDSKDIIQGPPPGGPYYDTLGQRVMGYYDGGNPNDPSDPGDLNYYYFMASNFATSDRFFNPVMSRTEPNRHYLIGATSQGEVYPVGSTPQSTELTVPPIFEALQSAGITWKIYVNPAGTTCSGPPYQASCLIQYSYVKDFEWGKTVIPTQYPGNIGTIGSPGTCGASPCDFENDLANGTLPQVVQIEPASQAGLDEHGSDDDRYPINIQSGAAYVASIINSVMQSSSWADSAFILTYDEYGGLFDHVPPQPATPPDSLTTPIDLQPGDVCYGDTTDPICNFGWTGYRVPLIVVSPFARKNYVSHTVMDETAILKLIEKRFGVSSLTARDAAQPDMTEFFDFSNPPWMTPPNPPAQNRAGACYLNQLP